MRKEFKMVMVAICLCIISGSLFAKSNNESVINFCHSQAEIYYAAGKMREGGVSFRDSLVSVANALAKNEVMSDSQKLAGMKASANIIKLVYSTKKIIPPNTLARKSKEVCQKNHL